MICRCAGRGVDHRVTFATATMPTMATMATMAVAMIEQATTTQGQSRRDQCNRKQIFDTHESLLQRG